jgi:tetratricopeptide (TPR) repeat protein
MNEENMILQEQPPVAVSEKPTVKKSFNFPLILGKIIDVCILGLTVLMPLWFLPFTLDILELSKQTLLIGLSLIAFLAWIAKSLIEREIILTRSWLHLVVIIFVAMYALTTYFSSDRYLSFVGNVGQMQWSFITIASFTLMYFVIVNRLKTIADIQRVIRWFLLGSLIAGLYGLLQMLGVHILGSQGSLSSNAFNTIGTINAFATYLSVAIVVAIASHILGCSCVSCGTCQKRKMTICWDIVHYAMVAIGLTILSIADFWPAWTELIVGLVVLFGIQYVKTRKLPKLYVMIIAGAMLLLSVLMLIFPTPINLQLPSEVSPSAKHSWSIAQTTLQNHPLFGSGPGTWIYDYAKYRSVGVNTSQFWSIRFDRGLSAFLTMIAMLGLVGTCLWLILVGSSAVAFIKRLVQDKDEASWNTTLTVFVGWFTLLVLAFVYNYNVVHHFAFWMFLSLLGVLISKQEFHWDQKAKSWVSGLLMGLLILVGVGTISAMWINGQRLAADIQYSSSVSSFQKGDSIDTAISKLTSAITLNRLNDNYHRNLSQAYLVKVSQLLQNADEAKVKEAGGYIQQSVNSAKNAIAQSPNNVDNYSNLGIIYQAITSFIPGADEMAIKSYEEALALEPNNPVFMNEIGKLYVLRSDAYRTALNTEDAKVKEEAQKNVDAELERSADWFNKAISVKPDYAVAHYNLGLTYERQGRLPEAITKFEQVLSVNTQDASVAFQLAILYYRNGNKDASRTLFEQVIQAQPTFADARWFLATIYEEDGKLDLAIEQIKKIQETNPENQAVTTRITSLEQRKVSNETAVTTTSTQGIVPLSPDQQINPGPTEQNPIQN